MVTINLLHYLNFNYGFVGRSICILYLTWRHWVPPQPVPQTGVLFGSASSNCSGNHLQLSWDSRGGKKGNKNQKFPVLYPITCCTYIAKTPFLSSGCFKNSLFNMSSNIFCTVHWKSKHLLAVLIKKRTTTFSLVYHSKIRITLYLSTQHGEINMELLTLLPLCYWLMADQFLRRRDCSPTGKSSPTVIVLSYYTRFSFIFLTLYIITDIISRSLLIVKHNDSIWNIYYKYTNPFRHWPCVYRHALSSKTIQVLSFISISPFSTVLLLIVKSITITLTFVIILAIDIHEIQVIWVKCEWERITSTKRVPFENRRHTQVHINVLNQSIRLNM